MLFVAVDGGVRCLSLFADELGEEQVMQVSSHTAPSALLFAQCSCKPSGICTVLLAIGIGKHHLPTGARTASYAGAGSPCAAPRAAQHRQQSQAVQA